MSPDNYLAEVPGYLRSARRSIRIEQQYIRASQPAIRQLLAAIVAARAANPELEVRIIVSAKFEEPPHYEPFCRPWQPISNFSKESTSGSST